MKIGVTAEINYAQFSATAAISLYHEENGCVLLVRLLFLIIKHKNKIATLKKKKKKWYSFAGYLKMSLFSLIN